MMTKEYEKYVFSEYHDNQEERNVYLNASDITKDVKIDRVEELQKEDTVECLYEWIKAEGRDIAAFREAIMMREKYGNIKKKTEKKQKEDTKNLQNIAAGKKKFGLFGKQKQQNMSDIENRISHVLKKIKRIY